MKRAALPGFGLIALLLLLAVAPRASAAANGVRDEAHFFSPDAISRAEQTIGQINQKYHKDVLVQSLSQIPQDLQSQLQQEGKDRFFKDWAEQRAHQLGIDGIYILITRTPGRVEVWLGNRTEHLFTNPDRERLQATLLSAFREKQYDQGLDQAVQFIRQQMDAHAPARGGTSPTGAAAAPPTNYPQTNYPAPPRSTSHWGFGGIACVVIGVIILIMLIRAVVGRSMGGRPGGYYPPQGGPGYPPGGAGYPPAAGGYGYGGGGGGGFGRGLLGGLLGGALGGYAGEKWAERGQQQGGSVPPPQQGGGDYSSGVDTSGTATGGDFDSGSGSGGGGDFSGGGGGADFGGGGGGDAGSSGGGDFGGGGGSDFGGGGDSGSSGGGDF
jgi:uncharacterized membrane protein YgcG